MTYQGSPRPPSGKTWADADDTDGELPPWAGLGVRPRVAAPSQPGRRRGQGAHSSTGQGGDGQGGDGGAPPGSRLEQARRRARRARRSRYLWAAAALVVIGAAVVVVPRLLPHPKPPSPFGDLVTTFQPGEFQTVPNACTAVTPATLNRYLPGTRRRVVPHSLDGRAQSMCDWSVDAPPVYRLLNVTVQAYSPSGLASGNGSATNAAIDSYKQALQAKLKPLRASHQPPATMTGLPGMGSAAFSALQVLSAGGDTTDLITVVVRQRNVLITVVVDGLAHSPGGRYGPVSVPQLQAAGAAAARDVLAAVH